MVHKKIRLLAKDEKGISQESTQIFAWLAIYRNVNEEWKLEAIASTNEPQR
jgi:hypothetical protein